MAGILQDFSQSLRRSPSPPPSTYQPRNYEIMPPRFIEPRPRPRRAPPTRAPRRSRSTTKKTKEWKNAWTQRTLTPQKLSPAPRTDRVPSARSPPPELPPAPALPPRAPPPAPLSLATAHKLLDEMRARAVAEHASARKPRLAPLDASWSPPLSMTQPDVVVSAARAVLRERCVATGVGEWLVRLLLRVEADPLQRWAAKLRRLDAYLSPPIPYDASLDCPAAPAAVDEPFSAATVDALAGRSPTGDAPTPAAAARCRPSPLDRARFLNATAQPTPAPATARRRLAFDASTKAPSTASTRSSITPTPGRVDVRMPSTAFVAPLRDEAERLLPATPAATARARAEEFERLFPSPESVSADELHRLFRTPETRAPERTPIASPPSPAEIAAFETVAVAATVACGSSTECDMDGDGFVWIPVLPPDPRPAYLTRPAPRHAPLDRLLESIGCVDFEEDGSVVFVGQDPPAIYTPPLPPAIVVEASPIATEVTGLALLRRAACSLPFNVLLRWRAHLRRAPATDGARTPALRNAAARVFDAVVLGRAHAAWRTLARREARLDTRIRRYAKARCLARFAFFVRRQWGVRWLDARARRNALVHGVARFVLKRRKALEKRAMHTSAQKNTAKRALRRFGAWRDRRQKLRACDALARKHGKARGLAGLAKFARMRLFKRRHRAAVVLQCAWRCFEARRGARTLCGVVNTQRRARGNAARRSFRKARAARRTQAHFRGFLARKLYNERRRRCVRTAANFRRNVARGRFVALRRAAIWLTARARQLPRRRWFVAARAASTVVGRRARGRPRRVWYAGARAASIALEALMRGELARASYTRLCAAIWIETYCRGFAARARFVAVRNAAVRAQTRARGRQAKRSYRAALRASIVLETWVRHQLWRLLFRRLRSSALLAQRHTRGMAARREAARRRRRRDAATAIQSRVRGISRRVWFLGARAAATVLEALARGFFGRRRVTRLRAAIAIEAAFRRYARYRWYRATQRASVCVQRRARGVQARRRYAEALDAACTLETTARRHLATTSYKKVRVAVVVAQKRARATAATREASRRRHQRDAATLVQTHWRARAGLRWFDLVRCAVARTQAAYRGVTARKWYRRYLACRSIQGPWRGAATRRVLRREVCAAAMLGRHERARQFRGEVRRAAMRWRYRNLRLTRLQALARGFTRRQLIRKAEAEALERSRKAAAEALRRSREAAAEALQRWARCRAARWQFSCLRSAEAATRRAGLLFGAKLALKRIRRDANEANARREAEAHATIGNVRLHARRALLVWRDVTVARRWRTATAAHGRTLTDTRSRRRGLRKWRRRTRRVIHERIDRGAAKFLTRLHGAVCTRKASQRARSHYLASLASHVFQSWWLRTFGLANAVRRVLPSEAVRAVMELEEFDSSRYDLSVAFSPL